MDDLVYKFLTEEELPADDLGKKKGNKKVFQIWTNKFLVVQVILNLTMVVVHNKGWRQMHPQSYSWKGLWKQWRGLDDHLKSF